MAYGLASSRLERNPELTLIEQSVPGEQSLTRIFDDVLHGTTQYLHREFGRQAAPVTVMLASLAKCQVRLDASCGKPFVSSTPTEVLEAVVRKQR